MAYGNYIASVPLEQIAALREGRTTVLQPTRVAVVSHLLSYWIPAEPIGRVLREVLDEGERLADGFEHPLRPPLVHTPHDVARLLAATRDGLQTAAVARQTREIDWFQLDIASLITVMEVAASRGESFVSALDPPRDLERAAKVRLPFEMPRETSA